LCHAISGIVTFIARSVSRDIVNQQ
jgi:hypothetical protein